MVSPARSLPLSYPERRVISRLLRHAGRLSLACALVASAALGGSGGAPAGASPSINLLAAFRERLPSARSSRVTVLLPRTLTLADRTPRVYAGGGKAAGGWVLVLAAAPRCGGATACFIASFQAERGKSLPERAKVKLADGTPAAYHPVGCGASCSPASLWFRRGGILYSWQVKDLPRNPRAVLVALANEAIAAGGR